jgi:hypothetical protein
LEPKPDPTEPNVRTRATVSEITTTNASARKF